MKFSEAVKMLAESGVDNPKYDAAEIFSRFGGFSRQELLLSRDIESTSLELIAAIKERAERKPLQYIIGEVGFYRELYKVTEDCLIPRSDTEILVDYAVKNIPQGARFLDLCTGSGCVAISTLKNTKDTLAVAVDISDGALAVAKENAEKNGLSDRIEFIRSDVLEDKIGGGFFAILSNPPYVSETAYADLSPEIYYEPKMAFVGGRSGLAFYERITGIYKDSIPDGGFIAYEIGFDQADALKRIAKENGMQAKIIKDLSGNDRVCIMKK